MKNFIKNIFKKIHICVYLTPIASRYISFNTRDIVYECSCGKRKLERVFKSFSDPFPIETNNFMTKIDIENLLANKKKSYQY